jgi:transposase
MLNPEEWMDINDLHRQGNSIRQIAQITGYSRNTVRRVLRQSAPQGFAQPARASKLDPFKAYLAQRLGQCSLSAVRLLGEISPMGFSGSIDIVQRYVKELSVSRDASARATVRFETPPGAQAQVDWASCGRLPGGQSVYAFVMVLGFSRMLYAQFTLSMDVATLLECHKSAFAYFGGWTQTILYDNMKQVRLGPDRMNPLLLDFAHHYGFTPKTHRVRRPRTKGKVERMVDYLKDNFVLGREFADLADINAQCRHWLDHTANIRIHATTDRRPVDLLREEKDHLSTVTSVAPYPLQSVAIRRVDAESFVHLGGSRYSAPPEHVGKSVTLMHLGHKLIIRSGDLTIAEHPAAPKRGSCMADPKHVEELWKLSTKMSQDAVSSRAPWHMGQELPVVQVRALSVYEEAVR